MALKFKTREEIPAEQLPLYTERDGAWLLDVPDVVEKAKHDELRNTSAAALKERDELKQRFDGIDPEQVRALLASKQKLEESTQLKAGGNREGHQEPDQRHQGRSREAGFRSPASPI